MVEEGLTVDLQFCQTWYESLLGVPRLKTTKPKKVYEPLVLSKERIYPFSPCVGYIRGIPIEVHWVEADGFCAVCPAPAPPQQKSHSMGRPEHLGNPVVLNSRCSMLLPLSVILLVLML